MKHASKIKFILAIFLVALVSVAIFAIVRARQKASARQLLDKIAGVYQNCNSYQDTGDARLEFKSFVKELRFATSFVRPARFRYEYLANERMPDGREDRFIIRRNGSEFFSWFSLSPQLSSAAESFSVAIAGATGVSAGTANAIPALLFSKQEIKGRRLNEMTETTQLEDARIDDTECMRLKGRQGVFSIILWAEKDTFLVRRIERVSDNGTKLVVNYRPILNAEIPQQVLDSTTPKIR